MKLVLCILVLYNIKSVLSWDSAQLEVFDVVEEVKVNFYEFLSIPQDADLPAIKKTFRRLSLELHPDKNPSENADEEFRNLVAIYDVLKDTTKRKYYNEVLINGLPNWRSAVYYYRHVRRIGLLELCLLLLIIISIGQYLVGWATYFEKKYTLDQVKGRKLKKIASTIEIPKPSLLDTLPIQIPKLLWLLVITLPTLFNTLKEKTKEKFEKYETESEEEEINSDTKTIRKRKPGFIVPEGPTFETANDSNKPIDDQEEIKTYYPQSSKEFWTNDNLGELIQLINRFPGGIPGRWELIAENIGRPVTEVTNMASKLKANGYRLHQTPNAQNNTKKKIKTEKIENLVNNVQNQNQSFWTQDQQKAMENALLVFPKGHSDRWDHIAEQVPGKSKEQCMLRYKHLVELVKKQKETKE